MDQAVLKMLFDLSNNNTTNNRILELTRAFDEPIQKDDYYKFYHVIRLQELKATKKTKIHNDICISRIWIGSNKVISGLSRNDEAVKALVGKKIMTKLTRYILLT